MIVDIFRRSIWIIVWDFIAGFDCKSKLKVERNDERRLRMAQAAGSNRMSRVGNEKQKASRLWVMPDLEVDDPEMN